MLNINRKLSQSGFSLIELMVAVAILAMAIFGIFHAYSVGFMGMADARDRTVATNYVRETLENIKNMDFLKIENAYFTTEEIKINGKIFTKSVHIDKIDDNLKKATSWVSWYNRNNKLLEVKNTMLIQNSTIKSDTGTAVKIVLYADPYYNVIPGGGIVSLTAVLKDQNGNILTKWDNTEDVSFSIFSSTDLDGVPVVPVGDLGSISPTVVTLNQGSASTVFTSGNENLLGYVTIQALVVLPDEGQLTDTVTLKITDAAVAINLVANPQTILTDGNTSNIIATIVDSEGEIVDIADNLITFSISDPSLGSLEGPNPVNASEGTANIILRSTVLPGTVIVSAFATDLQTGTIEVTISEVPIVPASISISADPISIYNDESSDIAVTIKDQYGNPVGFTGEIGLAVTGTGSGTLGSYLITFNNQSSAFTSFNPTHSGLTTVTASGDLGGDVGVVNNSVTINIYDYPITIRLTALPESIKADGSSYSQIKATLVNSEGIKVPIANNEITFSIFSGPGILEGTNPVKAVNGEANIILRSTVLPGTATITGSAISVDSGTVDVIITGTPKYISMSVNPTTVALPNEIVIITVKVLDINENPVEFTGEIGLVVTGTGSGTLGSSPSIPINLITFNNQSSTSTNFYPTHEGKVKIEACWLSGEGDISGVFYSPEITIVSPEVFVLYKDIGDNYYLEKYDYNGNYKHSWNPIYIIYGKFCVDKSNNLYIINENNIFKKDSNGLFLLSNPTDFPAQHINIGGDGNIYYTIDIDPTTNGYAYKIIKIDPDLNTLSTQDLKMNKLYYGLAVDSDGSIYIHNCTDQAIEKWLFDGSEPQDVKPLDGSFNYGYSELTIAGNYIGIIVEINESRNSFIIQKDLSLDEETFTLTEITSVFYISSISGDFLFSGLNNSDEVVFGRYGTDGSLKWNQTITKIDDYPYLDCIIGAYPF